MKKIVIFCFAAFLFSCQGNNEENIVQEFFIASQRQSCSGFLQNQQCLMIKLHEDEQNWGFLYNPISGFDHEEGFEYKVRVLREYIPENENIADSSLYEYTLLEILSKEEKDSEGI